MAQSQSSVCFWQAGSPTGVVAVQLYLLLVSCMLSEENLLAAASPALGHPHFYPSPERPIGWRGDGSGAFPGAILVDQFGDGPAKTKVTPKIKNPKKKDRFVYADLGPSRNIVWKTPLPGFTMSQPIVIGDRVYQTCEPRSLLCFSMHDGGLIWKIELDPFVIQGRSKQDKEKAKLLESTAWTLHALAKSYLGNYSRIADPVKQWPGLKKQVDRMRWVVEQAADVWPEPCQKVAEQFALMDNMLAGDPASFDKAALGAFIRAFGRIHRPFDAAFFENYHCHATLHWYSWVGWTWPTPVTDGRWLYVFMNQGQIAKISAKDGSLAWKRQLAPAAFGPQPHPRSPLLHDGVMIMAAFDHVYGIDAETGRELYAFPIKGLSQTDGITPVIVPLSSGRHVLAVAESEGSGDVYILNPNTGSKLAHFVHRKKSGRGPSLMAQTDILIAPHLGHAFSVSDQTGEIELKVLWTRKTFGGGSLIAHAHRCYWQRQTLDVRTGDQLLSSTFATGHMPGMLVGDKLLGNNHSGPTWIRPKQVDGIYRKPMYFHIHDLEGSVISTNNILQWHGDGSTPVTVPQAQRFLGELIKPEHLISEHAGLPHGFGFAPGFAQGNRLVTPSIQHLYCIGDPKQPYNGVAFK